MSATPEEIEEKANLIVKAMANDIWISAEEYTNSAMAEQKLEQYADRHLFGLSKQDVAKVLELASEKMILEANNPEPGHLGQDTDEPELDMQNKVAAARVAAVANKAAVQINFVKENAQQIAGMMDEQQLAEMGMSPGALARALKDPSFMIDKDFAQNDKRAKLTGLSEMDDFEVARAGNISEADRRMKMADLVLGDRQLEVQKAMVALAESYDPDTKSFNEEKRQALILAQEELQQTQEQLKPEFDAYKAAREELYLRKLEKALNEKLGGQFTPGEIKAAAKAIHESVIKDQDPTLQYYPTNEADSTALCNKMAENAQKNLQGVQRWDTENNVKNIVLGARDAKRNDLGRMNFGVMGQGENETNQAIKNASDELKIAEGHAPAQQAVGEKALSVREAMAAQAEKRRAMAENKKVDAPSQGQKTTERPKLGGHRA